MSEKNYAQSIAGDLYHMIQSAQEQGVNVDSGFRNQALSSPSMSLTYLFLGKDDLLVAKTDTAVRYTKKADWHGDRFKEREIAFAIAEEIKNYEVEVREVMELVKAQKEYL